MSTSTRVILDKKVRVSSNYLYVKIGGSTSILAPILEYYSSIMLGTRTRLQIPGLGGEYQNAHTLIHD